MGGKWLFIFYLRCPSPTPTSHPKTKTQTIKGPARRLTRSSVWCLSLDDLCLASSHTATCPTSLLTPACSSTPLLSRHPHMYLNPRAGGFKDKLEIHPAPTSPQQFSGTSSECSRNVLSIPVHWLHVETVLEMWLVRTEMYP